MKIRVIISLMLESYVDEVISGVAQKGYSISPGIQGERYTLNLGKDEDVCIPLLMNIEKEETTFGKTIKEVLEVLNKRGVKYYMYWFQTLNMPQESQIGGGNFSVSFDEKPKNNSMGGKD